MYYTSAMLLPELLPRYSLNRMLVQVSIIESGEGPLQWKKGSVRREDLAGIPVQGLQFLFGP